jgi:hypothetical protein
MKKIILAVALVFILAFSANAQIKPVAYAGGGISMPTSGKVLIDYYVVNLSDFWKMGPNFGGAFGIQIGTMFELTARIHFNPFPIDKDEFRALLEAEFGMPLPSGVEIDGPTMKLMEIGLDARFFIPVGAPETPFKIFIVGGVGSTQRSIGDVTVSYMGESETIPGEELADKESGGTFCFGGGFGYDFTPMIGMYMEGRYVTVMADPENYGWLQLRGGIKFAFGK